MGLDMYAYTMEKQPDCEVDFKASDTDAQIYYWRKHPNLHGWMRALYREKGGQDHDFNCVNLVLTASDLARLEADIKAKRLPDTQGFFFGSSNGAETNDDLTFIAKAREELASGAAIYYTSWW